MKQSRKRTPRNTIRKIDSIVSMPRLRRRGAVMKLVPKSAETQPVKAFQKYGYVLHEAIKGGHSHVRFRYTDGLERSVILVQTIDGSQTLFKGSVKARKGANKGNCTWNLKVHGFVKEVDRSSDGGVNFAHLAILRPLIELYNKSNRS